MNVMEVVPVAFELSLPGAPPDYRRRIMRKMKTTSAITRRVWMSPPPMWKAKKPKAHATTSMISIVSSITVTSFHRTPKTRNTESIADASEEEMNSQSAIQTKISVGGQVDRGHNFQEDLNWGVAYGKH